MMEPFYLYPTTSTAKEWTKNDVLQRECTITINQQEEVCKCQRNEVADKANAKTLLLMLLVAAISLLSGNTSHAQSSQQTSVVYKSLSPTYDHYKIIGSANELSKGGEMEQIAFPAKDFRRGAYLKMRTVYLDIPVEAFKIKPYPANSSEETRKELDFLLALQQKRTASDIATTDTMAIVYYDPFTVNPLDPDYSRNVSSLFYVGRNLGPWFNPTQLPVTSRVLQNVIQDATFYFFSFKAKYNRAIPYHLEPALQNLEAPGHASYPSGHSSASHIHAYLLSHLLPAYKNQFLGNAYDMAFSREIRGVHYPSDSEAGREFAAQFVAQLLKSKKFKADLQAMKAEITNAMNTYQLSLQK